MDSLVIWILVTSFENQQYPEGVYLLNNQSMVKVVKSGEKNDIFWKVCKSLRDNKTFYSHY